jgi:hypothetical protein
MENECFYTYQKEKGNILSAAAAQAAVDYF